MTETVNRVFLFSSDLFLIDSQIKHANLYINQIKEIIITALKRTDDTRPSLATDKISAKLTKKSNNKMKPSSMVNSSLVMIFLTLDNKTNHPVLNIPYVGIPSKHI